MKILTIATACFLGERRELLLVRKQNTVAWMLPGGKLNSHESPSEALIREVCEELQITLAAEDLEYLGSFDAVAANEADTAVHAHAFVARLPRNQMPKISAEIAEMRWLSLHDRLPVTTAPLIRNHIIPALFERGDVHNGSSGLSH